jgi:hypothetical protein
VGVGEPAFYSRDKAEVERLLDAFEREAAALRVGAAAAFHLRLTPTPPGWIDMALDVPVLDTTRAREELGWQPTRDAGDALLELLDGIRTETPRARRPSATPRRPGGPWGRASTRRPTTRRRARGRPPRPRPPSRGATRRR